MTDIARSATDDVVDRINDVRETFVLVTQELPEIESFRSLLASSTDFREAFDAIVAGVRHPRIETVCDGSITCAMIGSSAHGKTTLLDELFPDLARRGWLVTDVTDTTSQSLCIRYAPPGDPRLDQVLVHSWSAEQIKQLMSQEEVREQNDNDAIRVTFHDDHVVVDGSEASFPRADLAQFRFPRSVELRPFSQPYSVSQDEARDPAFIRSLTVKEQSSVMRTGALIRRDGATWNPLQLRAVVKDVSLCDSFERIAALGRRGSEDVARLTFVDTPGLATPGSAKDEVLRHFLEKKSEQIALQLWRDDELDIVIHLVLCGRSSDFAQLWKRIERTCDDPDLDGLEDRLILAVNGMNRYFTDPNIKEKYEDPDAARRAGDQFASTLESNILQNMSPRGRVRPARTVFLDSQTIVEALTSGSYAAAYDRYRGVMERWIEPGGIGRSTLEKHGLLDSFRANIDALCDPDDRGQGYLIRQLLELIDQRGPALLLRKVLARSKLLHLIRTTIDLLDRAYDEDGNLSRDAIRQALRGRLGFLDPQHLDSIETFAAEEIDEAIGGIVERLRGEVGTYGPAWVTRAFQEMTRTLLHGIEQQAQASPQVAGEFRRHFETRTERWAERWGYTTARLSPPAKGYSNSRHLITHCLRLHAREILFQLLIEDSADEDAASIEQTAEDRAAIVELRDDLRRILDLGTRLCVRHGVKS